MTTSNTVTENRSSYLKYLPAIYRDDEVMGQLLIIFESILSPIEQTIDKTALYFDPSITSENLLSWLAFWLDLSLDPTWPEERRRELVKSATELYRWRGTRRGLVKYLKLYTGSEPEIHEYTESMLLDDNTKLGPGTQLGSGEDWYHFTVNLTVDKNSKILESKVRGIIESQKPAHSTYSLSISYGN